MNLLPSPNGCPLLREMGRSRTEPTDSSDNLRIPPMLKRSTGDLTREHTSKRTLGEVIGLTLYQHKLITQAWPNIYSTGCNGQFASNIYDFLCRKCPKARILFKKANTVASFAQTDDCYALHAKVTVELIDAAIRGLDTEHVKFTSYVYEIGKSHRHLRAEGLTTGMWDELGDAIIEALRRYESVRKHKELRRAWLALIAYITDNMKQGQTVLRASSSYEICDYGSPKKV
ncbi:unnamed protein product [Auanema sp. JU1783]|nr:unnamed protein product [Auanema sp. JU1783]